MNNKELIALLVDVNESTNEISDDIQDLIAKQGAVSPEAEAVLTNIAAKLKAVAAAYTPEAVEEEEEEGGEEEGGL